VYRLLPQQWSRCTILQHTSEKDLASDEPGRGGSVAAKFERKLNTHREGETLELRRIRMIVGAVLALLPGARLAQSPPGGTIPVTPAATPLPPVEVIATSPLRGLGIDRDKVPSNAQSLPAPEIMTQGPTSFTTQLNQRVGSVNIEENQGNPFQPDVLYRGFEGSPILGTPIGIAVYQNGVRLNEPFGDNINWDLIPNFAINSSSIIPTNPVYGLNALGGAFVRPAAARPQSHLFRAGPAAPGAQHHHRVDVRCRPPLPLHDARRLWPARPRRGDPAGTWRMAAPYARAARRGGAGGLARGPQRSLSSSPRSPSAHALRSPTREPGIRRVFVSERVPAAEHRR
jgi:hypothetical protein